VHKAQYYEGKQGGVSVFVPIPDQKPKLVLPPLRPCDFTREILKVVLDDLWSSVNALGGVPGDDYGRGFTAAVSKTLDLIEARGGGDRLHRMTNQGA
jgi:hypothetical protein